MKNDQIQKTWSPLSFAWELGYSIAVPLVVFTFGGRFLDKKFGTGPWLLLVGLLVSIGVTFFVVYSKLMKVIKDQESFEEKNKKIAQK